MMMMEESIERARCEELAKSSSFYRKVYSEIEEVGWESLRRLGGDLTLFSFQHSVSCCFVEFVNMYRDNKGRAHILELQLDRDYPKCPPSLSSDVPYMFTLEWSTSSRLKDVMHQFQKHLDSLQDFGLSWTISTSLFVLLVLSSHLVLLLAVGFMLGRIAISLLISTSTTLNLYQSAVLLVKGKIIPENLECTLATELPKPLGLQVEDDPQQVECGICYAQFLPTDEELGARSGTRTDYTCENISCNKSFHSLCLTDWLRSITTTRQSFDVLFGNCPYCSDPVAVKINNMNKID
ncbi:hypothetical protein HID58_095253 [Brassica napus]|uniref:Uncharacterized protein n=1 Tax=Brassica napus TaxID=3708 RepID=A0ABQ7X6S8_BRANA|nr:hypothetical protein HID58_095253 [Brassica napus]